MKKLTEVQKRKFLEQLERVRVPHLAAKACGLKSWMVADEREVNEDFDREIHEILERDTDELVVEARRRAVEGVRKPIIGGRFKDEIVAHEMVYSDGLLQMLLKARRSEFRNGDGASIAVQSGVVVVPGMAGGVEEWEKKFGKK